MTIIDIDTDRISYDVQHGDGKRLLKAIDAISHPVKLKGAHRVVLAKALYEKLSAINALQKAHYASDPGNNNTADVPINKVPAKVRRAIAKAEKLDAERDRVSKELAEAENAIKALGYIRSSYKKEIAYAVLTEKELAQRRKDRDKAWADIQQTRSVMMAEFQAVVRELANAELLRLQAAMDKTVLAKLENIGRKQLTAGSHEQTA